jgi:tRNA-modifying protein YgfZ
MGWMSEHATVARLKSRALVRVEGPDWRTFLQGLLSQDVDTLADSEVRFSALLNPQGKLLFDLFLVGRAGGCLIDVAADRRDDLVRRLTMYRLRAKVEIAADAGEVLALWLPNSSSSRPERSGEPGPRGVGSSSLGVPDRPFGSSGMTNEEGWAPDPRLPELGLRGYGAEPPAAAALAEELAYDAWRLSLGVPDPAKDCPFESDYPIEANFDLLNGIDFQKGCFVGQETTSRMKRRGLIKSRMVGLAFDGAAPAFGAEILARDLRAGEVRTAGDGKAMALVRLDRIDGAALTVDGRPVQVLNPNYIPKGQET